MSVSRCDRSSIFWSFSVNWPSVRIDTLTLDHTIELPNPNFYYYHFNQKCFRRLWAVDIDKVEKKTIIKQGCEKTWYGPYVQCWTITKTTKGKRISFELFLFATIVSFPDTGIWNENLCLFFLRLLEVSFINVGMIYDFNFGSTFVVVKNCAR